MSDLTLEGFIKGELERVHLFKKWYIAMHELNPDEFPLVFERFNVGLWDEALGAFCVEDEVYSLSEVL